MIKQPMAKKFWLKKIIIIKTGKVRISDEQRKINYNLIYFTLNIAMLTM